ncbi:MAG: DUF4271 domain-containing protein [Candidatus Cryptobacteroides sp.]
MDACQITLSVATGVALLTFLPFMDQYIRLCPVFFGSLFNTATAIRNEDKCKISRSRNTIFAISILPLAIFVWHNGLFCPNFMEGLDSPWDFLATAGALLAYFVLRAAIRKSLPAPKMKNKVYAAYCGLPRTFAVTLLSIVIPIDILMDSLSIPGMVTKIVFYSLTGICYLVFLIRRFDIFASESNFLQAILYLCSHEIVPTALLIVTVLVF